MRERLPIYAVLLAALGLCGWGLSGLTRHAIIALDKWGNAAQGISETTAKLNGKYGTIAETDKLLMALKSTTVHADMVIAHEDRQLKSYDKVSQDILRDVDELARRGSETLAASTQAAQEATETIKTANRTIEAAQPLLEASTHTVNGVDLRIRDPKLDAILTHVESTTGHIDGVSGNFEKVTTHFEQKIDAPAKGKWYVRLLPQTLQAAWQVYMAAK